MIVGGKKISTSKSKYPNDSTAGNCFSTCLYYPGKRRILSTGASLIYYLAVNKYNRPVTSDNGVK